MKRPRRAWTGLLTAVAVAAIPALFAMPSTAHAAPTPGPQTPIVQNGLTPLPARGALPVGQASYPIPNGALFVAPWGNDGANGAGSAPLRTVAAAVARVPWGGAIVMRGGNYRERVYIGKPLTIQNYPGEAAWFDGSIPATGWWRSGAAQWTTGYAIRLSHTTPASNDPYTGINNPLAAWPDMAFVNGNQLWQMAGNPAAGEFSVDYNAGTITIGTDPTGKDVRVSDLQETLVVGADDVTIQGIGFRRIATPLDKPGALFLARRDTVRNVVVEDSATTGIACTSDGRGSSATLDSVTVARSGMLGIAATLADGLVVRNSLVRESNYQRFNVTPSAAGIKVTKSRNITIDNNEVANAWAATGIWTDESVVWYRISRNRVVDNGHIGIEAEQSSSGIIAGNMIAGQDYGLYLLDTENTIVSDNSFSRQTRMDMQFIQDFRRQSNPNHNGHDLRYPAGDPNNTWILRDITVQNNILGGDFRGSIYQFLVVDRNTGRTADEMNIRIRGNAFLAPGSRRPWAIGWGRNNGTWDNYGTASQWAQAKWRPDNNVTAVNSSISALEDEVRWHPYGVPVESSVAAALGASWALNMIGSPIH